MITLSLRKTLGFVVAMMAAILVAQIAMAAPAKSKTKTKKRTAIASQLQKVETSKKSEATGTTTDVSKSATDRELMKAARVAFEKKDFKKSLELYERVPEASEYWIESVEERAWAHLQMRDHDKALGLVRTLMTMPFKSEIGAEPYLLSSLIQLRLCNYDQLFKVLKTFKEDVRPRYTALQTLAKTGENEATLKAFERAKTMGLTRNAAGPDIASLPKYFYRDAQLSSRYDMKNNSGVTARMKQLAERDIKETEGILRKMHLVEVEAVQRMTSHMHLADDKKASERLNRDANTLTFPDDEQDVWLDEATAFRVDANGCPGAGGPKS